MEEIHKRYKILSSAFHPDKLPPSARDRREEVQAVFLEFKLASKCLWYEFSFQITIA